MEPNQNDKNKPNPEDKRPKKNILVTLIAAVAIVTINVFGFLLALMLTQKLPGRNLFRTVFFMPNLIGGIVLGYIWQSMINGVLSGFGMTMLMDIGNHRPGKDLMSLENSRQFDI